VITGAELLCHVLEEKGVTCVFSVPGTQTLALHEALRRSRIRVVLATDERAASFMANGYYRASGRIAPLVTNSGPGFTYTLTGLAEALYDSAAVLYIVGVTPSAVPGQQPQVLDQRAVARPLVKGCRRIDRAEDIPTAVGESLALALGGEPGPVLLECAAETLAGDASPMSAAESISVEGLDDGVVERVATSIGAAHKPLLLAGQGCAAVSERLQELAELVGAPVVTTASARGVLPEDHPLALSLDSVRTTAETARELFRNADRVIVVGCKRDETFHLDLPAEHLVRVDTSLATLGSRDAAHVSIAAPAEAFFAAVIPAVRRLHRPGVSSWSPAEVEAWRHKLRADVADAEPLVHGALPATAAAFFSALRAALPREGIVVADSGLHQILLRRHFDVLANRGLLFPGKFQAMGFGLPAAIGAQLAAPTRPVVALIGDGGFAMSGLAILTAVREKIPLTLVVFADGFLNYIRVSQFARYGHAAHVDLVNPDFALFAAAVGARYARCSTDAEAVLRDAIGSGGVTVVEVPVGDSKAIHLSRIRGLARDAVPRTVGARWSEVLLGIARRLRRARKGRRE